MFELEIKWEEGGRFELVHATHPLHRSALSRSASESHSRDFYPPFNGPCAARIHADRIVAVLAHIALNLSTARTSLRSLDDAASDRAVQLRVGVSCVGSEALTTTNLSRREISQSSVDRVGASQRRLAVSVAVVVEVVAVQTNAASGSWSWALQLLLLLLLDAIVGESRAAAHSSAWLAEIRNPQAIDDAPELLDGITRLRSRSAATSLDVSSRAVVQPKIN